MERFYEKPGIPLYKLEKIDVNRLIIESAFTMKNPPAKTIAILVYAFIFLFQIPPHKRNNPIAAKPIELKNIAMFVEPEAKIIIKTPIQANKIPIAMANIIAVFENTI